MNKQLYGTGMDYTGDTSGCKCGNGMRYGVARITVRYQFEDNNNKRRDEVALYLQGMKCVTGTTALWPSADLEVDYLFRPSHNGYPLFSALAQFSKAWTKARATGTGTREHTWLVTAEVVSYDHFPRQCPLAAKGQRADQWSLFDVLKQHQSSDPSQSHA